MQAWRALALRWGVPHPVRIVSLRIRHLSLLLLCAALAACGKQDAPAAASKPEPKADAPIADIGGERVWQGVLPCSDCLGIDTRLVLREQGGRRSYRLEEVYLGAAEPNRFEREGRWSVESEGEDSTALVYVLDPDRAPRRFRLQPDGGVELETGDTGHGPAPEYRLQRL